MADATLEIVTLNRHGERIDSADADTPEAAIIAGRTLWDDAMDANLRQGYRVSVGFYVAGSLVRIVDGRP